MQFTATPDQYRDLNVFYTLTDSAGVVQFTGTDKLENVLQLKAARKKRGFENVFVAGQVVTTTVLQYGTQDECRAAELQWLRKNPWPALTGYCVCIDTGEQFSSVTEAAHAHGISGSALYNHLNGRSGYSSVKGRTYRKGIL